MIITEQGLGSTSSNVIAHTAVGAGLSTAAMVDPEPISKAILGVAALISGFFFKPDTKKLATTAIVNQAEVYMKQNLATWQQLVQSGQANETSREAALQNFNTLWQQVVNACSNPQYGSAGQACVADRQQGGKWDWFKYYYDPIASYQIPASNASGSIASLFGIGSGDGGGGRLGLLLGVGLIAVLVIGD